MSKKSLRDREVEEILADLLLFIGDKPDRNGLKDTPRRVRESWKELFGGYKVDVSKLLKCFHVTHDQIVIVKDVEFYSTCEHHMLPFFGLAHVGYLPNGQDVVGLSKIARLVDAYARRLQVQERLGGEIAEAMVKYVRPRGVGVILEAQHFCMMCRGVTKQRSKTVTSSMLGAFREDSGIRAEFMALIK